MFEKIAKNEKGLISIGLGLFMICTFGAVAVVSSYEEKADIEKARAGLEECPVRPGSLSIQTIWVKNCKVYIESLKSLE